MSAPDPDSNHSVSRRCKARVVGRNIGQLDKCRRRTKTGDYCYQHVWMAKPTKPEGLKVGQTVCYGAAFFTLLELKDGKAHIKSCYLVDRYLWVDEDELTLDPGPDNTVYPKRPPV